MKITEAKKEIENKLFAGAPLSLDAMLCALATINVYLEDHGDAAINMVSNEALPDSVQEAATKKLMGELQKGFESAERDGCIPEEIARKILFENDLEVNE